MSETLCDLPLDANALVAAQKAALTAWSINATVAAIETYLNAAGFKLVKRAPRSPELPRETRLVSPWVQDERVVQHPEATPPPRQKPASARKTKLANARKTTHNRVEKTFRPEPSDEFLAEYWDLKSRAATAPFEDEEAA